MEELGKKIIKIRKENNLTQEDFADKYSVTRQTVSSWENSKSYPDLDTLVKISDDFNISLDILLKEDKKVIEEISNSQRERKVQKKLKKILIILSIILLVDISYNCIYNFTKYISINHINRVLRKNNFEKMNDFTFSLKYKDNITCYVPSEFDMNKFLFKIEGKALSCDVSLDDGYTLHISWSDYNNYGALAVNYQTYHTAFTMDFNDEIDDRFEYIKNNVDIDETVLKDVINKGNELYKQLYK